MVDILLIQPPIRDWYLTAKRTIPYGLACIAASLLRHGFSVEILDGLASPKSRSVLPPPEMDYLRPYYSGADRSPFALFQQYKHYGYSFEHLGKAARDSGAGLIGISANYSAYFQETIRTAEVVKANCPECTVVVGGHHATVLPETVLSSMAVDFVLRGDGEISMPLLAKALDAGTDLDTVPGIAYRRSQHSLHLRSPVFMKSIPDEPLPATHLLKHRYYRRFRRGSAVIVASRGCPLSCSYCAMGKYGGPPYRRRGIQSVLTEIQTAVDRDGVAFVDFEDENLSLNRNWFLELLRQLKRTTHGRQLELRAMNGLLPSTLDAEVIAAMAEAGFKTLNLSLGTAVSDQQRRFRRPDLRRDFDRVLELTERHHLTAVGYVIAAAPFQSAEDSISDLLYLAQRRILVGLSIFYPAPESADFATCERLGLLPESLPLWRSTALPIDHTTSRQEAVTLLRLARLVNFMKHMADHGIPLPRPRDISNSAVPPEVDRMEAGRRLLSWFLHDGIIRGIDVSGRPFAHTTALHLTRMFIDRFKQIDVKGAGQISSRQIR